MNKSLDYPYIFKKARQKPSFTPPLLLKGHTMEEMVRKTYRKEKFRGLDVKVVFFRPKTCFHSDEFIKLRRNFINLRRNFTNLRRDFTNLRRKFKNSLERKEE